MAHDVFISYSVNDKAVADAVCASLEARKIRCWIAPRDVLPGITYAEALIDGLNRSRILVLVFSANSNKSPQVMREVERAVHKGIPIIPLQIEDVMPSKAMEYFVSASHWLDAMTPPLERHLQRLVDTVQVLLANEAEKLLGESTPQAEAKTSTSRVSEDRAPTSTQESTQPVSQPTTSLKVTAPVMGTTLPSNISGAICYFAGWLSGIVFLFLAKGDRFVLFHAWQSIITSGSTTLVIILLVLLPPVQASSIQYWAIYIFQWLFALLVIFLWIFLMLRAYKGHTTRVPLAGNLARKLADQGNNNLTNGV